MEEWKSVKGFEGLYEVSSEGRVRGLKSGKTLKPIKHKSGYLQVGLHKDGKYKRFSVHRLVAKAFIPNPDDLETVNHIDEDKSNNAASNLEWMTMEDNIRYSQPARTIFHVRQYSKDNDFIAEYRSAREACRRTRVPHGNIIACCKGRLKTAGGYRWQLVRGRRRGQERNAPSAASLLKR